MKRSTGERPSSRIKVNFYGSPYIGMFARANDDIALIPKDSLPKFEESVGSRLGVDTMRVDLCGSNLIGLYSAANSSHIIVPHIAYASEKKALKGAGLEVCEIETKNTAIGNIICCNDKGAIVSGALEPENTKKVADFLGIEVAVVSIADYKVVGSACVATNKGMVIHNNAGDDEISAAERIFGVSGINSTVNFGFPFPAYGIIANSNGYVVGDKCTGIEVMRIDQGLGFSRRMV